MSRAARLPRPAALLAAGLLALAAGCGSDDTPSAAPSATPTATTPAATASGSGSATGSAAGSATAGPGTGTGTDECGGAAAAVQAAVGTMTGVTGVTVIGQCTTVSVATTLSPGAAGAAAAKQVCEKAGPPAYQAGVGSVSVVTADNTELAVGIKGAPCLSEP
jgi:hypothetical protein